MKPSNKLITALLLSSGAAAGIAAINKYIKVSAVSKNLLQQPNPHCYRWRFGNIYYTKEGTGKPLLLLQLDPSISKFEFDEEKEPAMELPPAPAPPIPPGANPDLLPEFL